MTDFLALCMPCQLPQSPNVSENTKTNPCEAGKSYNTRHPAPDTEPTLNLPRLGS